MKSRLRADLIDLMLTPGLSGHEERVAALIRARLAAIGLTALIDGLWLERSLNPATFSAAEAGALADRWLDALIG